MMSSQRYTRLGLHSLSKVSYSLQEVSLRSAWVAAGVSVLRVHECGCYLPALSATQPGMYNLCANWCQAWPRVNTCFVIPQDSQWPRLLHCLDVMSTSLSSANLIIGTLQTIKHPMNTQRLARGCCAAIVALALLGDYWYVIPFTTEVLYGMVTAIAAAFGGVMLVLLPIMSEV
jgi:hypothetical protein